MKLRWTLSLIAILVSGCNPIEEAYEYNWSREASVEERMVVVETNQKDPQIHFAVQEILNALRERGYPAKILLDNEKGKYRQNTHISLGIDTTAGLKPQGYLLAASINDKGNPQFVVTGIDAAGVMYGGLHLSEAIRIEKALSDIRDARKEPYLTRRGLKISIPTETRTPGSASAGDSGIRNSAEMGKVDFWTEFLDAVARYRYNVLVLREDNGNQGIGVSIRKNTDLWRTVVQNAKDRGIQVYLLSADTAGTDSDMENNLRDSMQELIQTVPDLAGVGIAAGREEGGIGRILQVGQASPDWTFRYSRDRLYSSPMPPFYADLPESMRSSGANWWWDLNNSDIFVHRWGDPDYVREYLAHLPLGQTAGYFVGSDNYVWGREFISVDYTEPRQLEIVKHWYRFMLWGRLGYNPNLDRDFFEKVLHQRFPTADSAMLYSAWQASSKIIPLVDRFHWRNWDTMWTAEGCMGSEGFHTVEDFIDPKFGTLEGSGLISIPDAVAAETGGQAMTGTSPKQVANQLDGWADRALEGADRIRQDSTLPLELADTVGDIEAVAWLGKYYAAKIRGSFEYSMFKTLGQAPFQQRAVEHLTNAAEYWRQYARKDTPRYKTQVLAGTGLLDWWKTWEETKQEALAVRKEKPAGSVVTFRDSAGR